QHDPAKFGSVVLFGSRRRIFPMIALNLRRGKPDIYRGLGFLIVYELESLSCRKPLVSPHRFRSQRKLLPGNPIAASFSRSRCFPELAF
ncbi:MAG: hypothetical protein WCA28_27255, partial [Bradyrhizobium sp.]